MAASSPSHSARKAASEKAYREWLPVSDDYYTQYEIGQLATLFRLETRHLARSEQLDLLGVFKGAAPGQAEAAYAAFRDGSWRAEDRTLMGMKQESWLAGGLKASKRAGKRWQVLAQQVVMGELALSDRLVSSMPADSADWLKQRMQANVAAGHVGVPFNMDAWDGYPAARRRLFDGALAADAATAFLRAAGGRPDDALAVARSGRSPQAWASLPQAVARGDVTALGDWTPAQAIEALQKLCHDLLAVAVGAAPRYFAAADLPKPPPLAALTRWSKALAKEARTADHPFNAGLMLEALVAQARNTLHSRQPTHS